MMELSAVRRRKKWRWRRSFITKATANQNHFKMISPSLSSPRMSPSMIMSAWFVFHSWMMVKSILEQDLARTFSRQQSQAGEQQLVIEFTNQNKISILFYWGTGRNKASKLQYLDVNVTDSDKCRFVVQIPFLCSTCFIIIVSIEKSTPTVVECWLAVRFVLEERWVDCFLLVEKAFLLIRLDETVVWGTAGALSWGRSRHPPLPGINNTSLVWSASVPGQSIKVVKCPECLF